MAINPALLIAAPILQDYFSDNATDTAMSAGVITCYQDNSRTTLKNWYYQSGSPGAYTYVPLDNPLTLSAAGTISDPNGNDTIPFWYPFSELDNETPQPYYVTCVNANGQIQFTRQNFPFIHQAEVITTNPTFRNLIVNNVFWRNGGTIPLTNIQAMTLAPSQHDGFVDYMSDIQFVKNANGATDTVTFQQFSNVNRLTGDATPEFYLNFQCASSGSGETVKYIQIPICLHVDNLSGYTTAAATLWTQNVSGSPNNTITLNLYQFLGTGTSSPAATTLITITPSSTWQKTVVNFSFPSATLPPGGPGDDGWFLQIGFPVGVPFNMNIAKPSIYLSTEVPSDDFDTYEYVSGTIDAPRTGDVKISLSDFNPYGWVALNNGTIGNASSNATARGNIDTWPLFYKIWTKFHSYTSGSTNILAQMVNSSGSNIPYSGSAITDWNANNSIALTQVLGKILMGTVPTANLDGSFTSTFTASNFAGTLLLTTTGGISSFVGMPITFTNSGGSLPGGLSANTVYWVGSFNGSNQLFISTSFANVVAGVFIAYSSSGSGTNTLYEGINNSVTGEYQHTQLLSELASHTHTVTPIGNSDFGGSSGRLQQNATSDNQSSTTFNTGSTGSGAPFNVIQPSILMNMFMKL